MAQQINLLNPGLRPQQELLTPVFMLKMVAVFSLLLGVYGWSLSHEASKLAAERAAWMQRGQDEQNRLLQTIQQNPAHLPSKSLQAEIEAAARKLQERAKVFAALKSGSARSRAGFSGLLQGFARQGVNGLWLTGIAANAAGDEMRISGKALSPDLIPQYLKRLSNDAALHGRSFTSLDVSRPKSEPAAKPDKDAKLAENASQPNHIDFVISADKPEADAARTQAAKKAGANS